MYWREGRRVGEDGGASVLCGFFAIDSLGVGNWGTYLGLEAGRKLVQGESSKH